MSSDIITTEAETEFNARFPEGTYTDADAEAFAQAWFDEIMEQGGNTWRLDANWFEGYADESESGPKGVVSANWNYVSGPTQGLIERAGYTLEWCDTVTSCDGCQKCIETEPTHYGWKRRYHVTEGSALCEKCLSDDPEVVLADLRGTATPLTMDIDLADHGYVRVDREFENGLYGGQDDSPRAIAKALEARGVEDFIFVLDDVGQFDSRFSVWVKEEDHGAAEGVEGKADVDPARAMEAALRSIPVQFGPGIQYTTVHVDDGGATVNTRMVSPEEFINGIK